MERFKEKVVLVTGGTSGIGREVAKAFSAEGAKVVITARREKEGNEIAQKINDANGQAVFYKCDISKESEVRGLLEKTVNIYKKIDFACNNAAISPYSKPLHEYSQEEWDHVQSINLTGTWLCMKYEIMEMLKYNSGAVVNISSKSGIRGSAHGVCAYVSSKHGIVGLTRTAAIEYGKKGIRTNCICPGTTRTEMMAPLLNQPGAEKNYNKKIPIGRIAESEEIAKVVLFLCSDEASYVNGLIMPVDGGMTAI